MIKEMEISAQTPEKNKDVAQAAPKLDLSKKTTGEKGYDVFQFLVGKAWIMFFTAVIAYVAKYGKDTYHVGQTKIPNYFQRFQKWFEHKMLHNKVIPLSKKGEPGHIVAGALANTMVLFHGGNIFAPVMKWLENSKEDISNYFNKKFGKPGEEEIAHERLKELPKQTWGDIVKGRLAGWAIVFTSFVTAAIVVGKNKKIGMHRFDIYEEGFGRWLAGWTKKGRDLGLGWRKPPVHQPLTKAQDANKMYRFGKIVALDVYATSAALVIWNWVSRALAKNRKDKNHHASEAPADPVTTASAITEPSDSTAKFTNTVQPREAREEIAAKAKGEGSYTDMIARQELDKAAAVQVG